MKHVKSEIGKRSACDGKVGYPSKTRADNQIKYMRRWRGLSEPLISYHCMYCHKFHLGNPY